jgi:hypothetical protein
VVLLLVLCAGLAGAQARADMYFGLGTKQVGSTNELIDFTGTGNALPTGSMGGVFGILGGGVMLTDSLGVGGEVSFRFAQGDYAGLGYRPIFYDFNGIWTPKLGTERVMAEFQGGFGGVNLRFYGGGAQSCDYYTGRCSDFAGSSNHLQLHAAAGLRFYIKERIFIRPQLDYHWVRNLVEFKSNSVPGFSFAIGYSTSQ